MGPGGRAMPSVYEKLTDYWTDDTLGNQISPDAAGLADGTTVITWMSTNVDGSGYAILGARFRPDGSRIGDEFVVNTSVTGDQGAPAVTALSGGGFVIVWDSTWPAAADNSGSSVVGRRYDAAGNPGPEFSLNTTVAGNQSLPDVSSLSGGGFVAVWTSAGQDGSQEGVFGRRFDANGNPVGVEFQVNSYTESSQSLASVAGLPGGGFVVTWTSYLQDGMDYGIYAQRYGADGSPQGAEVRVNTTTDYWQYQPEVAALADGGYVIVWQSHESGSSPNFDIYAQRYDSAGQPVGGEVLVPTSVFDGANFGNQTDAHVTGLADGGFVVSWSSGGDVFMQRFDAAGVKIGESVAMNQFLTNEQSHGVVAATADGGFVGAWASLGQDGSESGVYWASYVATEDGFSTSARDRVLGTNENDFLSGLGGNDVLFGYAGDDVLEGGVGNDALSGGTGWDEASYEHAAAAVTIDLLSSVNGGEAQEDFFLSIEQYRLSGYDDRFIGSAGDDAAFGEGGNDHLTGSKGSDYLDGGAGDDVLQGGKGGDVLVGGLGFDIASYAQDTLKITLDLSTGVNTAAALGDVFDSIEQFTLTQLNDIFIGDAADNRVLGAGGDDALAGGLGNDYLDGGGGNDILKGGAGADSLIGGLGLDEANYVSAAAGVTINLASGVHGGEAAGDTFVSIERYRLSTLDDSFTGGLAAELVFGDAGNDSINGGGGNDDLRGEAGNDTIDGGTGADAMAGGIGNDIFVVDNAGDVVTELTGEGTDLVQSSVGFSLAGRYIENLTLTGGSAINGSGNSLDNVITGNGAANSLSGADGNDTLDGGGGIDSMSGGIGNDTYIVDNSSDKVNESNGAGTDTVQSSASFSLAGQYADNLVLTGAAAINGSGNSLANTITGNSAANSLSGVDGADSLYGKGGNDTLNGGTGTDSFYFDTAIGAGNVDTIQSFSAADDTIMLSRTIFSAIAASGTLAAGAFVLGTAAADADDRILYDSATGKIFYDADGNGAGAAVLFAQVAVGTALNNFDFVAYTG